MNSPLWVHRFAIATVLATLFLLAAGALVTGTGSGLAVPDWPRSFGQWMPPMEGGVFYEHGHRIVAGTVGCITVLLAMAIWWQERRAWVKVLALVAVLSIIIQALLGGLTVLLRLPPEVSVSHACLAQIFFSITVVLALVTSPAWERLKEPLDDGEKFFPIQVHCMITTGLFFLQLVLGATMRHLGAGLAIPDFPLSFGRVFPPFESPDIVVHFLHRAGAFILLFVVLSLVIRINRYYSKYLSLVAWVGLLVSLVSVQIVLGAATIWMERPVSITTTHLVVGALCLGCSVVLTTVAYRLRYEARIASFGNWQMNPAAGPR